MRWWMTAAVAAVGCVGTPPSDDGGQFGEESGAHCEVVNRTPVAVDEVSALGFSAQQVVDLVAGSRSYSLAWSDAAPTDLAFEVVPTGVFEYLEQEVIDDSTGTGPATEMAPWCPNELSIGATVTFVTADGAFDEALDAPVLAWAADSATLTDPLEGLTGSYDVWDHVPAGNDYDDARSWLDVAFDAAGVHGTISGQGSGTDGDTAYAENLDIATFGDPAQ